MWTRPSIAGCSHEPGGAGDPLGAGARRVRHRRRRSPRTGGAPRAAARDPDAGPRTDHARERDDPDAVTFSPFAFDRALVRRPGRSVVNGLSASGRRPAFDRVLAEHQRYVAALAEGG